MRVVYIASNPTGSGALELEREITEMQQRFAGAMSEPFGFAPLPAIKVEELPGELGRHLPDVVHIAAHGDADALALANEEGRLVKLTAEMLASFLPPGRPPRLVYLNACNSEQLAKALVETGAVAMAIGTAAPITNAGARAAARTFYERVASGATVKAAFDGSRAMLRSISDGATDARLYPARGVDPAKEVMYRVPALIADFAHRKATPRSDDHFELRIGVQGCPSTTTQVIFFTDDDSFLGEDEELEEDLTHVVRTRPVRGFVWTPDDFHWASSGDFRLGAVGVMAGGGCFAVEGMLCDALERRYRTSGRGMIPDDVKRAIETLRRGDGAEIEPAVWDEKVRVRAESRKARKRAKRRNRAGRKR